MSVFLFIVLIISGALAALFLVQTISSFACACIYLYGLLFSRVKRRLNGSFLGTTLIEAALFAIVLITGFLLVVLFIEPAWDANWIAGLVAFIISFVYCALQVPDKILAARMCAMKPFFAERAEVLGMKAALAYAALEKEKASQP